MACKYLHVSSTYTVNDSSTQVVLGFPSTVTVSDTNRFCLKVAFDPSILNQTYTLAATINGSNVPLWNKYGDLLTVADISKCRVYKGYYGATSPHVIFNDLPKTYNCGCKSIL